MIGTVVEVLKRRGDVQQAVEVWSIEGNRIALKIIIYLARTEKSIRFGDTIRHEPGDAIASWWPRGEMDRLPVGVRVVGVPKLVAG